jgi:6-phosphogluconolactonase
MPKLTPVTFTAFSFCILSFCLGCGSTRPVVCVAPVAAASSPATCSCGSGACPASYYDYLYAVDNNGEITTVPIHQIDATLGTPTTTPGPSASVGVAQVEGAFLYASDPENVSGATVDMWTINTQTGALTAGLPFVLGSSADPGGMVVAQNLGSAGPYLYVADAGKINALQVNMSTGGLTSIAGSPFASGTNMYLTSDRNNYFLFAAGEYPPGEVWAFTINASTGVLTSAPGSPFLVISNYNGPVQPSGIAVDGTGSFVYLTLPAANQIAAFSIGQGGVLTPVPGSPFTGRNGGLAIAATPTEFVYVANAAEGSISGYSINQTTGALTPVASSPFAAAGVTALTIDNYGNLYASGSSGITVFNVGASGELTSMSSVASSAATALTIAQP